MWGLQMILIEESGSTIATHRLQTLIVLSFYFGPKRFQRVEKQGGVENI
jgi:hypothetical protein